MDLRTLVPDQCMSVNLRVKESFTIFIHDAWLLVRITKFWNKVQLGKKQVQSKQKSQWSDMKTFPLDTGRKLNIHKTFRRRSRAVPRDLVKYLFKVNQKNN